MKNTSESKSRSWRNFGTLPLCEVLFRLRNMIQLYLKSSVNAVRGHLRWCRSAGIRAVASVHGAARLCGVTLLITGTALSLPPQRVAAEPVVLAWDYPTNELYGIIFRVKFTTALSTPLTNWLLIAETTNTTIRLDMIPAVYFFAVTASNFWSKAESPFSNIVYTPPVVKTNVTLTISK